MLANARMSKKSARGYARVGALARAAISAIDAPCVQARADAQRLRTLGARSIRITGNLKFDVQPDERQSARGRELRAQLHGKRVLLWASTREGEEAMLLEALPRDAGVLVVIVPRHRQRFEEVAQLLSARGVRFERRSGGAVPDASCEVFLGDSLGEMALYYALADVALIGGGFRALGGQNLIEACAAGVPVVLGPHMYNFAEATRLALEVGAAVQCADAKAALREASLLLQDSERRAAMAEAARALGSRHRGATERHLEVCRQLITAQVPDSRLPGHPA